MQEDGYTVTPLIITCGRSFTNFIYFYLALVYKVVIHVVGLVLAFLTRKVKVDPLNDSRYASIIIYCSCFLIVLVVVAPFVLPSEIVHYVVLKSLVFVGQCVFLGLTFVPKVRHSMLHYTFLLVVYLVNSSITIELIICMHAVNLHYNLVYFESLPIACDSNIAMMRIGDYLMYYFGYFYIELIQMVSLYKDPKGEKIFVQT